jgi:hypothetical protein
MCVQQEKIVAITVYVLFDDKGWIGTIEHMLHVTTQNAHSTQTIHDNSIILGAIIVNLVCFINITSKLMCCKGKVEYYIMIFVTCDVCSFLI